MAWSLAAVLDDATIMFVRAYGSAAVAFQGLRDAYAVGIDEILEMFWSTPKPAVPNEYEPSLSDDELVAVRGLIQERYETSAAPSPAASPAPDSDIAPSSPGAGRSRCHARKEKGLSNVATICDELAGHSGQHRHGRFEFWCDPKPPRKDLAIEAGVAALLQKHRCVSTAVLGTKTVGCRCGSEFTTVGAHDDHVAEFITDHILDVIAAQPK